MKWEFAGFYNWPSCNGVLDMWQMMNLQRATLYGGENYDKLRDGFCRECVCWRETGTCRRVLVLAVDACSEEPMNTYHCVCPILFFDYIGIKLPEFVAE